MLREYRFKKTYIATGYTDLRYGVNGLSILVVQQFKLNPFDEGTLFLFCGKKADRIKGIVWEGDGFLMVYKRVEKGKYQWPRNRNELKELSTQQYLNLVNGLLIEPSIRKVHPDQAG